jgi:hypothetical protein
MSLVRANPVGVEEKEEGEEDLHIANRLCGRVTEAPRGGPLALAVAVPRILVVIPTAMTDTTAITMAGCRHVMVTDLDAEMTGTARRTTGSMTWKTIMMCQLRR